MRTTLAPFSITTVPTTFFAITPAAVHRVAVLAACLCLPVLPARALPGTTLVSVGANGAPGDRHSGSAAISSDGRFVAFLSDATILAGPDANGATDVFIRELPSGAPRIVSTTGSGAASGGTLDWDPPALSADGRFVAFSSAAADLVPGDDNGLPDVFVRDLQSSMTERISVAPGGAEANGGSFAPSMSEDGRTVAFASSAANLGGHGGGDVYLYDRQTGVTTRASVAVDGGAPNGPSGYPALSADGRYLAFVSSASNLVADDTNESTDVFVRDFVAGTTSLVSVAPDGSPADDWSDYAPSISADGRHIAFFSHATNLVPGDGNGTPDIFVRDTLSGVTIRASVAPGGADGNDASWAPSLSRDGHYVAFVSNATNIAGGDTNGTADVFVRDLWLGQTVVASVSPATTPGDGWSGPFFAPGLSGDGLTVVFESWAANLVYGDTNATGDVFTRGPLFTRPYSNNDVAAALRIAGGIVAVTPYQLSTLNVDASGPSPSAIDFADAMRIARKAAGLEP